MRTAMTPITVTVTPEHLQEGWWLVQSFDRARNLLSATILGGAVRPQVSNTAEVEWVVQDLGEVIIEECPRCFRRAPIAGLTFHPTTGKVDKVTQ